MSANLDVIYAALDSSLEMAGRHAREMESETVAIVDAIVNASVDDRNEIVRACYGRVFAQHAKLKRSNAKDQATKLGKRWNVVRSTINTSLRAHKLVVKWGDIRDGDQEAVEVMTRQEAAESSKAKKLAIEAAEERAIAEVMATEAETQTRALQAQTRALQAQTPEQIVESMLAIYHMWADAHEDQATEVKRMLVEQLAIAELLNADAKIKAPRAKRGTKKNADLTANLPKAA